MLNACKCAQLDEEVCCVLLPVTYAPQTTRMQLLIMVAQFGHGHVHNTLLPKFILEGLECCKGLKTSQFFIFVFTKH